MGATFAALTVVVLAPAGTASAAPQWSDGQIAQDIDILSCGGGLPEKEIGAYVGQFVDPDLPSPVIGEIFDVHVVVSTIGNSCAGTAPTIEMALPPGVSLALSKKVGIRCFLGPFGNMGPVGSECPDAPGTPGITNHPATAPWYNLNPDSSFGGWPLPTGNAVEIQVPVKANRLMSGIGDPSGCSCVMAAVHTVNGESQPNFGFTWAQGLPSSGAYQPLFVFKGGKSKYKIPSKVKRKKLLKKGLNVTVDSAAGKVTHSLKAKGSGKVASAKYTAGEPGKTKVKMKVTKKGKKILKKGAKKLKVTATAKGVGAKTTKAKKTVKVK
ncbi:MAG: hypothetical protein ACR2N5_06920 [Solirubrobacterales bacterium]